MSLDPDQIVAVGFFVALAAVVATFGYRAMFKPDSAESNSVVTQPQILREFYSQPKNAAWLAITVLLWVVAYLLWT